MSKEDEDEEEFEKLNHNKYEFLNAPILLEEFRNKYLSSLNIFLNDDKFKEKTDSLPSLKSSTISKYEKLINKEQKEKEKKRRYKRSSSTIAFQNAGENIISSPQHKKISKKLLNKGNQLRYIINDHELIKINLQVIEENSEMNKKLTDPFNSYFHESNSKIRKKALEQIINSLLPKGNSIKEENNKFQNSKSNLPNTNNTNDLNIDPEIIKDNETLRLLHKNYQILHEKFQYYQDLQKKKSEKYAPILKQFSDSCENHGIITLDQKIDYFVYLHKTNALKQQKPKFNINNNIKIKKTKKDLERLRQQTTSVVGRVNRTNTNLDVFNAKAYVNYPMADLSMKYINELKNKYNISDEFIYNIYLESFEKDLDTKIKEFDSIKIILEKSPKFIDKLRMYLRWKEVSNERIILRESDIDSEKFLFLIYKKYFNFGKIQNLNLEKNNLGDIGLSYLLALISKYSVKLDYFNIGYNKMGKQSIEILKDILNKNNVKLIGLNIGGNKLGDLPFCDIATAISNNKILNKLFINDNDLGKISSEILGTVLKMDKKIKFLDVSKNKMGDDIIGSMLKGLICNNCLETLVINDMGLTNKSLRIFETTLCTNNTLKTLFLERNKLTYKGWRLLSEILNKNRSIEYISLVGNNFENEYINLIIEQQRQVKCKLISKTDYFIQLTSLDENLNLFEYLE